MVGKTIGRLLVISEVEKKVQPSGQKKRMFMCECSCGTMVKKQLHQLRVGRTTSCGCYQKEMASKGSTKHGLSGSKINGMYRSMKSRCLNPNNQDYKSYGGRGITICERWLKFENFYEDIKGSYQEGLTIERIDVNKGYYPDNVKWIPNEEQARNKTTNIFFEYNGERLCLSEICKKAGVPYHRTWQRMFRYGKNLHEAISG